MQSRIKFQKAHGNARHPLLRSAVKLEVTIAVNFTIRNIHYETFCHLLKSINSETFKTVTVAKLGNHVHVTRIQSYSLPYRDHVLCLTPTMQTVQERVG